MVKFKFIIIIIIIVIIIIIIIPCKVFTPTLADVFSLKTERHQVSLGLQISFQYSGQSQQCCSFDGPNSFSNF